MEKNYRDKLFNKDVLESGLSINTIYLLRMMGYSKVSDVFNEGPLSFGQVATTEYNEETKEVIVTANGIEVYRGKNLNPLPSVDPNAEPTVAQ